MKIAASEAQWNTCQPCGFSLFQIGGFTKSDQTPSFSITIPRLLSYMATGSFNGQVQGLNELQAQEQRKYGRGNYMPNVASIYWAMRVMAYTRGADVPGRRRRRVAVLEAEARAGALVPPDGVVAIAFPFIAATAGWVLTEMGRQPWIVQGLLKTTDANSPSVSTTWLAISLAVFVLLYVLLGVVDFVLMRRYARATWRCAGGRRRATGGRPGSRRVGATRWTSRPSGSS